MVALLRRAAARSLLALFALTSSLLLSALFTLAIAQTPIQYVYDEAGRLLGVISTSGEAAYYSYDPAGNIASIQRISATEIALAEFSPNSGAIGTTVTLWGSGFSTTASQNIVRFNGISATVSSATANKLVVTVPAGATTGTVSVTSPIGTATSSSSFTVLANNGAPTISSFTPAVGAPGTTVTINGSRFDTMPGATKVEFNGRLAFVDSATVTDTTLNVTVPAASSGKVRVSTINGSALSSSDFIVPPAGINAADILVSKRATVGGAAQALNISTASKVGVLLFDGTQGQSLSVNLTVFTPNPATSSVAYEVYSPNGARLTQGSVSSSARSIHLPLLPQSGTYAIYFKAGTATVNLSAAVVSNATLSTTGTAANTSLTFAGQSLRLRFTGTAGKDWTLNLSNVVMSTGFSYLTYNVYRPDGAALTNGYCYASGSGCSNVAYGLPVSGTYTVVFTPYPNTVTGSFSVKSWESSRVTGSVTIGTAKATATTIPGQLAQYTFNGTAGQQLGLALSAFTTSISNSSLQIYVYRPDGNVHASSSFNAAGTATTPFALDIPVLPTAGTYTVQVRPYNDGYTSLTNTFSGQVLLTQDVAATLATEGTATNISLAQPGQQARVSFNGTAGKDVTFNVANVVMASGFSYLYYTLYKPDGSYYTAGYCYSNGSGCTWVTYGLPVSGTYNLVFTPYQAAATGSFSVKAWESTRVTGSVTSGTAVTATTTVPGQLAQYTFSGTAGQQLGLSLSAFTTAISNSSLQIYVYRPDGNIHASSSFNAASTATTPFAIDIPVLPATGTYVVQLRPYSDGYASLTNTFSGQVLLSQDVAAVLTTDGASTNLALTQPGQQARVSFAGTAGKDVTFNVSGVTMSSGFSYLYYTLYKPDGSYYTAGYCYSNGSGCTWTAYDLPGSGTYSVVFTPYPAAATGSFSVKAWESSRVTGSVTSGTAVTATTTIPGQLVQYTFSGTAGQQLGLSLSAFTTAISNSSLQIYVYRPDGNIHASSSFNAASTATTPFALDVPALPTTGNYVVQLRPYSDGYASLTNTFNGQVLLSQDVAATLTTDGTATSVALTQPSQQARVSFAGTAGKDVTFNISNVAMSSGFSYLYYTLYKPDGGYVNGGYCYANGNGCNLVAYSLPTSGTYSIVFTPYLAASTGSFSVKAWESSRVTGSVTPGTALTATTTVPGQLSEYSFSGTAGQQLGLALSSFTTSVTNANLYVAVLRPDRTAIATGTFTSSNTTPTPRTLDVPVLPTTGTYTVQLYPYADGSAGMATTFSGQVLVTQDVAATLTTDGTATNVALTQAGQQARVSFSGTAGKDVTFNISNVAMSSGFSYLYYTLYKPDGGYVNGGYCYANGNGCSLAAYALPTSGTYSIVFTPYLAASTGSFSVRAWESSRATGSLALGTASTVTTTVPGQLSEYSFSGTAGQQLGLALSSFATSVTNANLYVAVLRPDRTAIASGTFTSSNTTPTPRTIDIPALPTTGTYIVQLYPYADGYSGMTTTFSGQVLVTQDVAATLTTDGTATNVALTQAGQQARVSFTGTAGKDVTFNVGNVVMSSGFSYLSFNLYKPDGGYINGGYCYANGNGCNFVAYALPVSGTYTIVFTPYQAFTTGSFSVKAWESNRVTGSLALGTASTVTTTIPGQLSEYSFSGTAGQQLGLALSSFTTSVTNANLYVAVLRPDRTAIASGTFTSSNTSPTARTVDIPVLPTTGTYIVQVYPYADGYLGMTTTFSGQVLVTQDVAATLTTNGTATNITLAQPGQQARASFTGTAGKDATFNISNLAMSSGFSYLSYYVYKPDGGYYNSGYCYTSGSGCNFVFYALPVSGNYSIVLTPQPTSATGSFSVKAWESSRVTGSLTLGVNLNASTTVPGQLSDYTFSGTSGQLLRLSLSNFTFSVSGANLTVTVVKPDGSTLASTMISAANTAPTPRVIDLTALPTSGNYIVRFSPYNDGYAGMTTTFNGQALLSTR